MVAEMLDVIQIGYGPVGEAMALMLGRQGRSIAVVERWTTRYPLPRAVCIDHELYRVLSANGMKAELPAVSHGGALYQWFNAEWKELLVIDWGAPSISGGPEVNFVHQPTLEEALDRKVMEQPSVCRLLGWEVTAIAQDAERATVTLRHAETDELRELSARYVIGCDGANSVVRTAIGGGREDRGFEADWLVIDVRLKEGVTIEALGIPAAGQYCNPARPTTIVPAGVRNGRRFRRWEFMLLPGEAAAELEREERVWALLKPWADPDQVELVRHKVYNFRSLIAERWRNQRLLIAGDAAHVMPPFMGQGMCAGLRDAWNLAWKLGLVLDGRADDSLLDTYQVERAPHVGQIVDASIYLGKLICMSDPEEAEARDRAFFDGAAEPPPPFPHLTDGLLWRDERGVVRDGAGLLSPHVQLAGGDRCARLDEITDGGSGFVVIARGFDPERALDDAAREALEGVNTRYLALMDGDGPNVVRDLDGRLDAFFGQHGWAAMIVRPDFYVFGGVESAAGLPGLADDMLAALHDAGVRATTSDKGRLL